MIKMFCSVVLLLACFTGSLLAQEAEPKKVVLVCGPPHYSPDVSMTKMKTQLEELGFSVTLVLGEGNAEKKRTEVLPGIKALKEADLAIFFMRYLQLADEEWQPIEDYLKSGKPVIGFRTSNHAFHYPKDHPRYAWNDGFGRRVFGTPYVVHQRGSTQVSLHKGAEKHPILSHVDATDWVSPGTLYLTRLEPGVKPLVIGRGKGVLRVLEKDYGVEVASVNEADAVAWTWENEWGGKVFFTSLGHLGDFKSQAFNRMWINSVFWSVDLPVPDASLEVPSWTLRAGGKGKH